LANAGRAAETASPAAPDASKKRRDNANRRTPRNGTSAQNEYETAEVNLLSLRRLHGELPLVQ
jgi:hypothetical protein